MPDLIANETEHTSGDAWVAYIDVYGFSEQVALEGGEKVYGHLAQCLKKVSEASQSHNVVFSNLSDSLFFFSFKGGLNGNRYLDALVDCLAEVQDKLVEHQFVPRGSLAHGRLWVSEKVIVGEPIIRAARAEASLGVPCVVLPHKELLSNSQYRGYIKDIELKDGGIARCGPIFPRTLVTLRNLIEVRQRSSLVNGPPLAARDYTRLLSLMKDYEENNAKNARPATRRAAHQRSTPHPAERGSAGPGRSQRDTKS